MGVIMLRTVVPAIVFAAVLLLPRVADKAPPPAPAGFDLRGTVLDTTVRPQPVAGALVGLIEFGSPADQLEKDALLPCLGTLEPGCESRVVEQLWHLQPAGAIWTTTDSHGEFRFHLPGPPAAYLVATGQSALGRLNCPVTDLTVAGTMPAWPEPQRLECRAPALLRQATAVVGATR